MSEGLRLRVATFNIHGGRPEEGPVRLVGTAAAIAALEAPVVGLQEVFRNVPPPGVPPGVPQDQPRRLRRLLGGSVTFAPALGSRWMGYGNALLSPTRPVRVRRTQMAGEREVRGLLEAWLRLEGRPVRVLCTHLSRRPEFRKQQVRLIAARLQEAELPTVLLGDLNAEPESEEIDVLLDAGLRHAVRPDVATFPASAPRQRLDYILVSRGLEVEEGAAVATEASDHLPLVAALRLPG